MTEPIDENDKTVAIKSYADGSYIRKADRVQMWFETFNSFSNGPRVEACAAAQLVHGFIPSIYKGPRP